MLSFSNGVNAFGVGVRVGVGDAVADGVGVGVGSGDGDGEGEGVGVATGNCFLIGTPLFQTRFFPDLMQVNFLPDAVAVDPALVHLAPALTAAKDGAETRESVTSSATKIRVRLMCIRYQPRK